MLFFFLTFFVHDFFFVLHGLFFILEQIGFI